MKTKLSIWLLLFCLMTGLPACGQETASAPQQAKDSLLQQSDTAEPPISPKELNQSQAWDEVYQQFLRECLGPFLRKRRIRLNCSTCDRILFSYLLKVDDNGHITQARQLSRQIGCTQLKARDVKALDAHIQAYFEKLELPPVLYNSTYEGPFSIMLKC